MVTLRKRKKKLKVGDAVFTKFFFTTNQETGAIEFWWCQIPSMNTSEEYVLRHPKRWHGPFKV